MASSPSSLLVTKWPDVQLVVVVARVENLEIRVNTSKRLDYGRLTLNIVCLSFGIVSRYR
jgi:hypothetical protein